MDQPLGNYIGNALEVEEAIDVLAGRVQGELKTVSLTLGAHILRNAGVVADIESGKAMLEEKIASGEGLKKFSEMIEAQGGDPRVAYDTSLLPKPKTLVDITADRDGYVTGMTTSDIGNAARLLGAGRLHKTDVLDLSVGLVMKVRVGDQVRQGDVLCTLHVGERSDVDGATALMKQSIAIGDTKPEPRPLIRAVVE
jgi:thymidine phosphorylase